MNDKKIYLKKIEDIGKHTVWLVDGEYVRKNINENFVCYDGHCHLPFIPKEEYWIDKDSNPAEWHFFVDHLVNEQWEVEKGTSYAEAAAKADRLEKKERAKLSYIEARSDAKPAKADVIEKLHKKRLTEFSTNLHIWLVDGTAVRDNFLVEYADGGHDRVYSFIPKGEIWLEEVLPAHELKFILLHELHERHLMSQGKDYAHAHRGATDVEDYYRDHPAELDARIKEEIAKNEATA